MGVYTSGPTAVACTSMEQCVCQVLWVRLSAHSAVRWRLCSCHHPWRVQCTHTSLTCQESYVHLLSRFVIVYKQGRESWVREDERGTVCRYPLLCAGPLNLQYTVRHAAPRSSLDTDTKRHNGLDGVFATAVRSAKRRSSSQRIRRRSSAGYGSPHLKLLSILSMTDGPHLTIYVEQRCLHPGRRI